jgi:hypothetical protein
VKLKPGCPPPKIAELLTRGANLPNGMDRAWVRLPLASRDSVWYYECLCALKGRLLEEQRTREPVPRRTISLARIDVVLACPNHEHAPEAYWTGFCPSCCVVYWAHE